MPNNPPPIPPCFDLYDPKLRQSRGCSLCPHQRACIHLTEAYDRKTSNFWRYFWGGLFTASALAGLLLVLYHIMKAITGA